MNNLSHFVFKELGPTSFDQLSLEHSQVVRKCVQTIYLIMIQIYFMFYQTLKPYSETSWEFGQNYHICSKIDEV